MFVEKPDYSGMTVNERLFVAGTLEEFDVAIRKGEREFAVALLRAVDLETAEQTVDAILPIRPGMVD
jgi:hypothetical protein